MTDKNGPEKPGTPGMAEVSAKFIHEAEAATAAPPSSASVPDDPLPQDGLERLPGVRDPAAGRGRRCQGAADIVIQASRCGTPTR